MEFNSLKNYTGKTKLTRGAKSYTEATTQIMVTSNYALFDFYDWNRDINEGNYNKIIKKIEESNKTHLFPIVVDANYRILDGQHRFLACQEKGLPIYFVVDREATGSIKEITDLNVVGKKHQVSDRVEMYIKTGNAQFQKVQALYEKMDGEVRKTLIASLLCSFSASQGVVNRAIISGTYQVNFWDETCELLGLITNLEGIHWRYKDRFVSALLNVYEKSGLTMKKLMARVVKNKHLLEDVTAVKNHMFCIRNAYNHGLTATSKI